MEKYTQKQLRNLVKAGAAVDLTNKATAEDRREVLAVEGWLDQVGYAAGVYGCNGQLFKGHNTGKLYAITSRTMAIYIYN